MPGLLVLCCLFFLTVPPSLLPSLPPSPFLETQRYAQYQHQQLLQHQQFQQQQQEGGREEGEEGDAHTDAAGDLLSLSSSSLSTLDGRVRRKEGREGGREG